MVKPSPWLLMRCSRVFLGVLLFVLTVGHAKGLDSHPIPLIRHNGRLFVEAIVTAPSGRSFTAIFLLDTGSSVTWVDPTADIEGYLTPRVNTVGSFTRIEKISTPYGTYSSTSDAPISRLLIGDRSFADLEVPCVTLGPDQFESSLPGPVRNRVVLGVLGTDLLFSESFFLSISRAEMAWTTEPPFLTGHSQLLRQELTGGFVLVPRDRTEPRMALIDTGTYPNLTSQEQADQLASAEPRLWRRIRYEDGTGLTIGRVAGVPIWGLSTWDSEYESWGTAYLSRWDLWFERDAGHSIVFHWASAEPEAIRTFDESVDLRSWRFNPFWGFNLRGLDDPVVVATSTWGDGTPVVDGVKIGDRLVEFNGSPVLPGPDPFTFETGPFNFTWQRPDGGRFHTQLVRQEFH